jgi:hypothetical protein
LGADRPHTKDRAEAEDQLARLPAQKADGVPIARAELTLADAAKNTNRMAAIANARNC